MASDDILALNELTGRVHKYEGTHLRNARGDNVDFASIPCGCEGFEEAETCDALTVIKRRHLERGIWERAECLQDDSLDRDHFGVEGTARRVAEDADGDVLVVRVADDADPVDVEYGGKTGVEAAHSAMKVELGPSAPDIDSVIVQENPFGEADDG